MIKIAIKYMKKVNNGNQIISYAFFIAK